MMMCLPKGKAAINTINNTIIIPILYIYLFIQHLCSALFTNKYALCIAA